MSKEEFMDLFIDQLNDAYSAETQIIKALPKAIKAASSADLKNALETHLKETQNQLKRLEKAFKLIDEKAGHETCEAMQGIILECDKSMQEYPPSPLRDAAIITGCQRIEHYEIAVYGTLCTFAKELDLGEVHDILGETLEEEKNADEKLTGIAEGGLLSSGVNQKALKNKE